MPVLQELDQKGRGRGFKPVVGEFEAVQIKENIKGIVNPFSKPVIAVIPLTNCLGIDSGQALGKYGFEFFLGISADTGIPFVQGDIFQIVQPAEEAHFAELADSGQQDEA